MGVPTFMYSAECPKGRVFDSDKIPAGWVDSPSKIKAQAKRKNTMPQRAANGDA